MFQTERTQSPFQLKSHLLQPVFPIVFSSSSRVSLHSRQRWPNFSCKGPDDIYFLLCELYSLCHNYLTLLQHTIRHRQFISKQVLLFSNKISFTKTGSETLFGGLEVPPKIREETYFRIKTNEKKEKKEQAVSWIWPTGHSQLTPALGCQ